jgi:hypothetical protein
LDCSATTLGPGGLPPAPARVQGLANEAGARWVGVESQTLHDGGVSPRHSVRVQGLANWAVARRVGVESESPRDGAESLRDDRGVQGSPPGTRESPRSGIRRGCEAGARTGAASRSRPAMCGGAQRRRRGVLGQQVLRSRSDRARAGAVWALPRAGGGAAAGGGTAPRAVEPHRRRLKTKVVALTRTL